LLSLHPNCDEDERRARFITHLARSAALVRIVIADCWGRAGKRLALYVSLPATNPLL
jgi:hypothetical protein